MIIAKTNNMNIENIQALIAQGLLTDAASLDFNTTYVTVGVYQPGNRQNGSSGNAYPSYAIPVSEFLAGSGLLTGVQNGLSLVGTVAELGGTLVHTTDVNINGYSMQFSNGIYPILFLDPGKQQVAIGGNNPKGMLDITAVGSGTVGLQLNTASTQDAKIHFRTNNAATARAQVYVEDASQTLNVYTVNSDTIFWNGNGLAQTKTLTLFTNNTASFESNLGVNGGVDPSYALTIGSKATGAIRLYNSIFANMLTVTDASFYNFSAATRVGISAAASATSSIFVESFSALATDYSLNIASVGSVSTYFSVRNDGFIQAGTFANSYFYFDPSLTLPSYEVKVTDGVTASRFLLDKDTVNINNAHGQIVMASGDLQLTATSRIFLNAALINAVLIPVGEAAVSLGDLYVDTAANILANGDLIVARKV